MTPPITDSPNAREPALHPQMPEVSVRFRATPIAAAVMLVALWPFGVAYGVVGTVFGLGLLGLTAAIGLPKSVDLMFGLVLILTLFAAQFLGAVFLGIEAGGATVPIVFTTVAIWFIQLSLVAWELNASVRTVLVGPGATGGRRAQAPDAVEAERDELEVG